MSNAFDKIREISNKPLSLGGKEYAVPKPRRETREEKIRRYTKETSEIAREATPTIDFLKEIPSSTKKVVSFIKDLGKEIIQGTARSGGSVGLTLMTPIIGTKEITSEQFEKDPVLKKAKEIIFGKDAVKSLQQRIAEAEQQVKPYVGSKYALPLAAVGVGAFTALDFTTGGGKDDVVKLLAKTDKVGDIANILRKIGVADDLLPSYSRLIAKTNKADDIVKALDKIQDIQKTTKPAVETSLKSIGEAEKGLRTLYAGKKAQMEDALGQIWQEMDMSEAGERFMTETGEFVGKTSSFPDWIPEHLRSKKLFDKVMEGLYDIDSVKFPAANKTKQRELYNTLLEEAEKRIGINASKFRNSILETYEQITKTQKAISGGFGRGISEPAEELARKITARIPRTRKFLTSVKEARPDVPLNIAGQYIPRSTDDLAIKAKNLIKNNLQEAEKVARTQTDDIGVATASELIKHYSDEAIKATDGAVKDALYEKASSLAHLKAEQLTELGRSIQAASIMGRQTPEGLLKFAAKEINKYNEALDKTKNWFGLKKKIPQLTKEQTKFILKEFKKIEKMKDGTEKAVAFKKLNNTIAEIVPSSLFQKVIAVWKAGLLTGIKTSGLNTFSNLSHGISETIKDIPAAAVDSVASLFTKKRTLAFTTKGTKGGIKKGFEKGWNYLKTGIDERNIGAKLDYKKVNFGEGKLAKTLQNYEETIFHLMGAEDQPFYYGAKAKSLYSQAIAQAKNKGLKGNTAREFVEKLVKSPTDKMLDCAVKDAEIAVFQNQTTLGKLARGFQKLPVIGEVVVPFGRTPSAVANQLINYSPVGIIKAIASNIGKGQFDQRLFSQAVGRGITGSALMYLGGELFKKGMVSLDYPKTERERELWKAEGRKSNAIKIGNKWRGIGVLGPAGFVLIAGAHFQRGKEETGSVFEGLSEAAAGGLASLKEQTFLRGINSVVNAIDDPGRYGSGYFSSLASSVIPTIVGDFAKSFDGKERRTTETLFGRVKAKIPGLRQTLEPQVDILGKEVKRGGNWLETMIDPSRPERIIEEPVVLELRRLFDTGYKISPTMLGDKAGYENLSPEENTYLWKKTGELLNSKLEGLFNLKQYQQLEDEEKAKLIDKFVGKAKKEARVELALKLTEGLSGSELKSKLSEFKTSGLLTKTLFKEYLRLAQ